MGSCRVENTETKEENCRLDYPALSCNDVSAWTSTVVVRERRLLLCYMNINVIMQEVC